MGTAARTSQATDTAAGSAGPSSGSVWSTTRTWSTSSRDAPSGRRSPQFSAPTICRSRDHLSNSISTLSGRWAIIWINYFAVLSQSIYLPKTIAVSLGADLEGTPPSLYWSSQLSRDLRIELRGGEVVGYQWLHEIRSAPVWRGQEGLRGQDWVYSCHFLSQTATDPRQ